MLNHGNTCTATCRRLPFYPPPQKKKKKKKKTPPPKKKKKNQQNKTKQKQKKDNNTPTNKKKPQLEPMQTLCDQTTISFARWPVGASWQLVEENCP